MILLSKTGDDLQSCLNRLAIYCDENRLSVNLKKTKIVVFCKSGRIPKKVLFTKAKQFTLLNALNHTNIFVLFLLHQVVHFLYVKQTCIKAYFKVFKVFESVKANTNTFIHLFYHTIKIFCCMEVKSGVLLTHSHLL